MEFTDFGKKLSSHSGILQLMDDIARPLPPSLRVRPLGGGNPARVGAVEKAYRAEMEKLLQDGERFENVLCHYDSPQGRVEFLKASAAFFRKSYGWDIDEENIALTNGSQSAMFYLFNLFSGTADGRKKTLLFPLMPEYIGYADQGIESDTFVSLPSKCEYYSDRTFKYILDTEAVEKYLSEHPEVGAMAVSRPTNPSGNVLTDAEIRKLSELAHEHSIPLIVDNAYGLPFPDIIFAPDAAPLWNEDIVLSMSLSKIGLPSIRTGIVIARKEIAKALGNINAIAALATGSMGPVLAENLLTSGELTRLASEVVRPFYKAKADRMESLVRKYFDGTDWYLHRIEGSIFCWLYLPALKIPTLEFYSRLMDEGVITVPGEYFFFGSDEQKHGKAYPHKHYDKCLRLNYSGDDTLIEEGVEIISRLYCEYSS
ncbi:MAG: valine--pyruvate transaminase [Spirochaetes bacterium]|uniref:Valine--pyruvate transaminase n=1 Tax=Candidatus Ornithospirochaeta stercoripullorum TaxID=2840899 RepID=A0A9D9DZE7_9SPIO|nr:valine--pyruvate transaminase [Candidatus Ornithospirochaeta stercoripullorum]